MNSDTILHRQVHQSWIKDGKPTSQVFTPTEKDGGRVSVYDGDMISALDAWTHYTTKLRYPSIGVVSVTVHECNNQDLEVIPDPEPFLEHVLIDFTGFPRSAQRRKAKRLKKESEKRGWQYGPIPVKTTANPFRFDSD